MTRYLLGRFLSLVLSLAVASVVIFSVIEVMPGDPASFMLGINAAPDTVAALRAELGLDGSVISRYFAWVGGLLTGDFGTSYTYRVPVGELLAARLSVSVPLTLYALTITILIAIPTGLLAAANRGRVGDLLVMGITQIGIAVPNFWFAMLLILTLAVSWRLFPAGGFPGWEAGIGPALWSLTLPAFSLSLLQASVLARVVRSSVIETVGQDYIRTARAKGLSAGAALWKHAVRNALIPVMTIIGMQFSYLLAGAVIIENVYYLPGLGRLVFQAIASRDLIVVESAVMVLVFAVILVNFLVEVLYAVVDPRLRVRR